MIRCHQFANILWLMMMQGYFFGFGCRQPQLHMQMLVIMSDIYYVISVLRLSFSGLLYQQLFLFRLASMSSQISYTFFTKTDTLWKESQCLQKA